jgi:hypothetical protein
VPQPGVAKNLRSPALARAAVASTKAPAAPNFLVRNAGTILPGVAAGAGLGLGLGYGFGVFAATFFGAPMAVPLVIGGLGGAIAGGALASGAAAVLPDKPAAPKEGFWAEHRTAITTGAAGGGALGAGLGYAVGTFASLVFGAPLVVYIAGGLLVGALAGGVLGGGGSAIFKK